MRLNANCAARLNLGKVFQVVSIVVQGGVVAANLRFVF